MLFKFKEMAFETDVERLLLAEYFHEWHTENEVEKPLKEWYAQFCGLRKDDSSIIMQMFWAFAGGVRYGQELARDLTELAEMQQGQNADIAEK